MPEVPALSDAGELIERVAGVFAPGGPLSTGVEGYEARDGQRRLACEVARTFVDGGTLVAEAGTGTGKTLAYLVPAVLSGRAVLISTGTRNLQDQVFYKDVPALARALGRPIRAAYMKGRTNYLCRHRFIGLREAAAGLPHLERFWLGRIGEWLEQTTTGDRAEIEELPDDLPFWSELTANADQCLGRDCPEYGDCFITRMRERAAEAELVIVNHHLLCADGAVRQGDFGEVIPDCELLVIDEAHQLEDVVTQYFGVNLGTHRVEELFRDADLALRLADGGRRDGIPGLIAQAERVARELFEDARAEVRRSGSGDRARLTAAATERLAPLGLNVTEAVGALAGAVRALGPSAPELERLLGRLEAVRTDLAILLGDTDGRYVHFIESRGRHTWMRAAPIDASALIQDALVARRHATVMTSATLAVDGQFDYAHRRLGTQGARTLQVPSEFDFARQSLLYLPQDLPDPRSGDFNLKAAAVMADLLACSSGRAFLLFTSYAALREVRDWLEPRVPWPILVQGSSPRSALLRDFRATPNAVLMATASFWQGVDVAGEALSCVVIDRLPFASPGDPLVSARIAAIQAAGGHPFQEYQVPLAALTLLQGLGRLIRTRRDRGVMSVLDPRLTTMGYGRRFLASVPPARLTGDLAEVQRFFDAEREHSPEMSRLPEA